MTICLRPTFIQLTFSASLDSFKNYYLTFRFRMIPGLEWTNLTSTRHQLLWRASTTLSITKSKILSAWERESRKPKKRKISLIKLNKEATNQPNHTLQNKFQDKYNKLKRKQLLIHLKKSSLYKSKSHSKKKSKRHREM